MSSDANASSNEGIEPVPTTSRRGRGRRKVTTTVRQEEIGADEAPNTSESETGAQFTPLFEVGEYSDKSIVRIRVVRKEPNEGIVGYLEDPTATESDILDRWGGSLFWIQGVDTVGRVRATKTIKIAGDPIFVSKSEEIKWKKARGLSGGNSEGSPPMSIQELMMFNREIDDQRRKSEEERRERERRADLEHQMALKKLEIEAEDRRRKDDAEREERRKRDEFEREDRKRKDDLEREDRRKKDAIEAEQRQQAHMQQTLQILKESSSQAIAMVKATNEGGNNNQQGSILETLKLIVAVKEAFAGEGEEPTDALSIVAKHGGEWLSSIGNAVGSAIKEVKGGGMKEITSIAPVTQSEIPLQLPASLQPKAMLLAQKIIARGQNPEVVIGQILDNINNQIDTQLPTEKKSPSVAAPTVATPVSPIVQKKEETKTSQFPIRIKF